MPHLHRTLARFSITLLVALCAMAITSGQAAAGVISPRLEHPGALDTGKLPASSPDAPPGGDIVRVHVILDDAGSDDALLEALERAGAVVIRLPDGSPARVGSVVCADIPRAALTRVASTPGVERLEPGVPLATLSPLNTTTQLINAQTVWSPPPPVGATLGRDIKVADYEMGWEPLHPDLFRYDGGLYDFEDVDGDGQAGAGDRVDLDGDGVFEATLSLLEGTWTDDFTGESEVVEPGYQPDLDWLYVDLNDNGARDFGAGFPEDTPGLGEPIFVADDVDHNGQIVIGERLLRLGTPKVEAIYVEGTTYVRGVNLTAYPGSAFSEHGTNSIGTVAGGWPGIRRYTGVAPGVDLLLVNVSDPVEGIAWAISQGAAVHFYETNIPYGPLDGSHSMSRAISDAANGGTVHLAASGNLANADHCMEITDLAPGVPTSVQLSTDDQGGAYQYEYYLLSINWTGDVNDVELTFSGASGSLTPDAQYQVMTIDGVRVEVWRYFTMKGTAHIFVQGTPDPGASLPQTTLTITATNLSAATIPRVRGVVYDSDSGWNRGVAWLDHINDDGSAIVPSTADRVIAVGAYGGVHDLTSSGRGAIGELRPYSGVGPRVDGQRVIDIAAPDDPFVATSARGDLMYSTYDGTSGALAHAAGAAALLVDSIPGANHDVVEVRMTDHALRDPAVGAVPNERFGFGKLDVGAARLERPVNVGAAPTIIINAPQAIAGQPMTLTVDVGDPDGDPTAALLRWDTTYDGVYDEPYSLGRTLERTYFQPGWQRVIAEVVDTGGLRDRALARFEVIASCEQTGCAQGCCLDTGVCGECPGEDMSNPGDMGGPADTTMMTSDTSPPQDTNAPPQDTSVAIDSRNSSSGGGPDTTASPDAGPAPTQGGEDDCACAQTRRGSEEPPAGWWLIVGALGACLIRRLGRDSFARR